MRVLVTGATGGLGGLIIEKLIAKGIDVIATSRNEDKASHCSFFNKVTYVPYNINLRSQEDLFSYFGKPDLLIHLAWEKLDQYKAEEHLTVILDDHKQFLSNLIDNGLKDVTIVGTCYEYGLQEGILEESMETKPTLPYSIAKDRLRMFMEEKLKSIKFNFKWVRIFYVFGEVKGRKNLYTHLKTAIANKEESFNMSGGEQVRDFLTPSEIADRIILVAFQNAVQGIVNCCSGKPVKLKEFVQGYLNRVGHKIKLNLGVYPYPDYEPMETWGSTEKLNKILKTD